jgi:predicted flap endonuclease-1-like 5' DNA nuclease
MDDGKLKTHRVGARAAGTGAKWGTILGATGGLATGAMAAAGILTGGIGLIPGAIAGLAVGAAGGALFHKRIGMTDADRQRIHDHLASGGAALAVMADANEVEPTKAEIAALGGNVEHFVIPEELMAEFEETRQAVEEIHDEVAEELADKPIEVQDKVAEMLAVAPAIGAATAYELHKVGIHDSDMLQDKAATVEGRAELAAAVKADKNAVQDWAHNIDLTRVRGLGPKYLKLLNAAGIETADELASYSAEDLAGLLMTVNAEDHVVGHMPPMDSIAYWVSQAKELPPYLVAIKVHKDMLNADAYSWHASGGDDPKKVRADAVMFNRKEGYEVQLMIQKVANTFGYETVEDVKRVENIIATELPGNVRSRENVYNWLVDYIDTH